MIVLVENKKIDNTAILADIASKLAVLSVLVGRLAVYLTVMHFHEGYLDEGTPEDRRRVEDTIKDIIKLIAELDQVFLALQPADRYQAIKEKQYFLNTARTSIIGLKDDMLAIWAMRDAGETPADNEKIHETIEKLFARIKNLIHKIERYVADFNKVSRVKLKFSIKWIPLPK